MFPRTMEAATAKTDDRAKMKTGKKPDPNGPMSDLCRRHSSLSMAANRRPSISRFRAQPTSTRRMKMSSRPSPSADLIWSMVP